jgi:hypothetical protein
MMTTNNADTPQIAARIAALAKAWEDVTPEMNLAGYTLTEFKAETAPSQQFRDSNATLKVLLKAGIGDQRHADKASREICTRIVSAVKADRTLGQNSPLYRAMGFIPTDERKTPKRTSAAAPSSAA